MAFEASFNAPVFVNKLKGGKRCPYKPRRAAFSPLTFWLLQCLFYFFLFLLKLFHDGLNLAVVQCLFRDLEYEL
jgi:hypothetical protein